jgi:hypothetical protein
LLPRLWCSLHFLHSGTESHDRSWSMIKRESVLNTALWHYIAGTKQIFL